MSHSARDRNKNRNKLFYSMPRSLKNAIADIGIGAGKDKIRFSLYLRLIKSLSHLMKKIPSSVIPSILSESSNKKMILSILEYDITPNEDSLSLFKAKCRGLEIKQKLLEAKGGVLSVNEVAKILGITRQAVDKRRQKGKLIAISWTRRGYLYPSWQFSENGVIEGLETVLIELKNYDSWSKILFMLNPNKRLNGNTPLEELRKGNIELVQRASRTYGEHGAA